MARDRVNKKGGQRFASRVLLISSPVADAMCARIMLTHYGAGVGQLSVSGVFLLMRLLISGVARCR